MEIVKSPTFIELDRRRELAFNLLTEARIQSKQKPGSSLLESIGEFTDEKTGEVKKKLRLNLENLAVYLWAALYDDAHKRGELLDVEDVGRLINRKKKADAAYDALSAAMRAYYGYDEDEQGE